MEDGEAPSEPFHIPIRDHLALALAPRNLCLQGFGSGVSPGSVLSEMVSVELQ